jgi:Na+/H+ antiporter NhaA
MAVFIAGRALGGQLLNHAKIGIMMGSLLSAIAGMALIMLSGCVSAGQNDETT